MHHEQKIWVLGGDMRQAKLAQLLAEDGHRVHTYALDEGIVQTEDLTIEQTLSGIERSDCVVLPLPVAGEEGLLSSPLSSKQVKIEDILQALRPKQVVCGGRVDESTRSAAKEKGITIHDYFAREELAVINAVATAEGALQIAMEQMPITIHDARVLVIGYGRVGKLVAQRFSAIGAKVGVAARRYEQFAWAETQGYWTERIGQLTGWLCGYDLVVNTVPSRVLGPAELADLQPDCLIIDLASKPGGVDFDAAIKLGRNVIWALSLPGKVAPVTAGEAIKSTIYNILDELS